MIPRSGGGGRNVNPGKADEVFAEHGRKKNRDWVDRHLLSSHFPTFGVFGSSKVERGEGSFIFLSPLWTVGL